MKTWNARLGSDGILSSKMVMQVKPCCSQYFTSHEMSNLRQTFSTNVKPHSDRGGQSNTLATDKTADPNEGLEGQLWSTMPRADVAWVVNHKWSVADQERTKLAFLREAPTSGHNVMPISSLSCVSTFYLKSWHNAHQWVISFSVIVSENVDPRKTFNGCIKSAEELDIITDPSHN